MHLLVSEQKEEDDEKGQEEDDEERAYFFCSQTNFCQPVVSDCRDLVFNELRSAGLINTSKVFWLPERAVYRKGVRLDKELGDLFFQLLTIKE